MFTKTLIALSITLVVATTLTPVANAQIARRQQAVQPFSDAERNWFEIPQGRELLPY